MRIIVTGASGLIGSALVPSLLGEGHEVTRLVRGASSTRGGDAQVRDASWEPERGSIDAAALEGHDAAIHLAGESVSERWTNEKKRRIRESRVKGTRLLAETLARLERKPRTLVCASAIGFYGDRGDELLTEESAPGRDFLAGVCQEWEAAADPARAAGLRAAHLRIGIVLSAKGGALPRMLGPFRMGAGGPVGGGRQWVSWIALDDVLGVVRHVLRDESLSGPINTVAPQPVRNGEFAAALGEALGRPALVPVPAFAVRLMFGEMGQALALSGQRVVPAKLRASGYEFLYPELPGALRHVLAEA